MLRRVSDSISGKPLPGASTGFGRGFAAIALAAAVCVVSQKAAADGSTAAPLTHQQLQQGYDDYVDQFPRLLSQPGLQFPADAPPQGGRALVTVQIAASGKLLSARISQSSGSPSIDRFALEDVDQTRYPPFNSRMPYKSFGFVLPITVAAAPGSASTRSPNAPVGPGSIY